MICYEVKGMKKHTVFLSDARGRGEECLPLLSSILFYPVSINTYLTTEISLHSFKHSSEIREIPISSTIILTFKSLT